MLINLIKSNLNLNLAILKGSLPAVGRDSLAARNDL